MAAEATPPIDVMLNLFYKINVSISRRFPSIDLSQERLCKEPAQQNRDYATRPQCAGGDLCARSQV